MLVLLDDPIRNLQLVSALAAFGVAHWLLAYQVPQNLNTAHAVFYLFGEETFAVILILTGLIQLFALGSPWWRLHLFAAWANWMIWLYAAVCYWLTNRAALVLPLLLLFAGMEVWVVLRILYDRTVNGDGQRGDH